MMAAQDGGIMDGEIETTEDALLQRHKRERKELLATTQKLKHSVPKGDKKKKKEMTEHIAQLEADMDSRQEQELTQFKQGGGTVPQVEEVAQKLETLATGDQGEVTPDIETDTKPKKASKAQKRREKKANQNRERENRIKEESLENITGDRYQETVTIKNLLGQRGLQIHEISSDGNCLYNAISHQLKQREVESSNDSLRQQTAEYMRSHQEDFLPFLTKLDTGDPYTLDEFQNYCNDIASTSAWGGHLELQALSHILKMRLEVIQAKGPSIVIGEDYSDDPPILLTYHRHAFGLGEHYNSVKEKQPETEEDGFS